MEGKNIHVFVKRDDLIHPIITGNKWRKLKEYIHFAQNNEPNSIISFGGAYSNHLYALAFVGFHFNLKPQVLFEEMSCPKIAILI